MVLSTSDDGWTAGTPLEVLTDPDRQALLAIGMNGAPLPIEHGFPVRMVVPGLYGYVSATKWVTELKVTTFAEDQGYWTPLGWSARGTDQDRLAGSTRPRRATIDPGTVVVAGVAWAQHTGIAEVEVQIDQGPWQPAQLAEVVGPDTWRQWKFDWAGGRGHAHHHRPGHRRRREAADRRDRAARARRGDRLPQHPGQSALSDRCASGSRRSGSTTVRDRSGPGVRSPARRGWPWSRSWWASCGRPATRSPCSRAPGRLALLTDEAYAAAGADVSDERSTAADVVVSVQPLAEDRVVAAPAGRGDHLLLPPRHRRRRPGSAPRSITTFGMEYVPRISRAQSMDALSSQSLVAGYRAAIVAAGRLRQFFPLSMTAAGTVPPAQVVVLGAGVAGLQAIATCRRLGAVVKGYDVRAAAAEEIRSMGAQAIELDLPTLEGAGGYAREMTEERAARQRELLAPHIAAADALITTAAVPGRRAPLLVTSRDGGRDEAGLGGGRPGGGVRRQRRGRPGRAAWCRPAACSCGAGPTCPARCRARPAGSTPRTSST